MNTEHTTRDRFSDMLTALFVRLVRAGFDANTVRVYYATLDETWGALMGYVVRCDDKALEARCAAFCAAWLAKHFAGKSSYDCQRNPRVHGAARVLIRDEMFPVAERCGRYNQWFEGTGVAEAYYPGAE